MTNFLIASCLIIAFSVAPVKSAFSEHKWKTLTKEEKAKECENSKMIATQLCKEPNIHDGSAGACAGAQANILIYCN